MNWVALISTLITFGWDGYLVQVVPQLPVTETGKKLAGSLLRRAVVTIFILYAVLIILLFAAHYIFKIRVFFSVPVTLIIFPALVFLFTGISFFRSVLRIFHRVSAVQWMENISKPLLMLVVIWCFYYFNRQPALTDVYYLNIFLFLGLLAGLFILAMQVARKKIDLSSSGRSKEKWLVKCFYFMCIILGYNFFSRMELLFLGYFNKNEDAAKYQLLYRISELVI